MTDKTENVPEWAVERALQLLSDADQDGPWLADRHGGLPAVTAFARYIAANEEAPVDPLVIEAREICAQQYRDVLGATAVAERYLRGDFDDIAGDEQACALAGLRRGIELAREHSQ